MAGFIEGGGVMMQEEMRTGEPPKYAVVDYDDSIYWVKALAKSVCEKYRFALL